MVYMVGDLIEGKGDVETGLGISEFAQPDLLKVGTEDVAGHFEVFDGATDQVVPCLGMSNVQVHIEGLGFTDDHTGPEQVNITGAAGGTTLSVLLEQIHARGIDAEAGEEIGPELLGILLLRGCLATLPPRVDAFSPEGCEVVEISTSSRTINGNESRSRHC